MHTYMILINIKNEINHLISRRSSTKEEVGG